MGKKGEEEGTPAICCGRKKPFSHDKNYLLLGKVTWAKVYIVRVNMVPLAKLNEHLHRSLSVRVTLVSYQVIGILLRFINFLRKAKESLNFIDRVGVLS